MGLINIQYAIAEDVIYVLEANPRASRTVPLVSKVCNTRMVPIATKLILGGKLGEFRLPGQVIPHYGVKEAVFPFNMYPEVDPLLGPEMRSTGEVLGLDESFGLAFYKAQDGAGSELPLKGAVLITIADRDKQAAIGVARRFAEMGFTVKCTKGTQEFLRERGIESEITNKMHESRPDIVDEIKSGKIQLVVNTSSGKSGKMDDSYIRKAAIKYKIPYITTLSAAEAAAKGVEECLKKPRNIRSLQEYHEAISLLK